MSPKPVAFIVESSSLSGGVRVIYEYATRLQKRGWPVFIYSLDKPPAWFDLQDITWNIYRNYDEMTRYMAGAKDTLKVATWWKTAYAIDKGSIDRHEAFYLVQDIETSYYYRPFMREAVMKSYGLGLKEFTCNQFVADTWSTLFPDDPEGVPCVGQAFNPQVYHPYKYNYPHTKMFLAVSRRQALKGFSELCEVTRRVGQLDPKAELWTFGVQNGTQIGATHTKHLASLTDNEVAQLYGKAGVFVCTSLREGFGLTMLEAMACGTAVACFDCDGNYFCIDGYNCLKVGKSDTKGLAEAIYAIMHDPKKREALVRGGKDTARSFDCWDKVIDRLEQVLSS